VISPLGIIRSELPDSGGAAQAAALAAGVYYGDESVLTHVKIYRYIFKKTNHGKHLDVPVRDIVALIRFSTLRAAPLRG
jgi:hypothetical protein